MINNVVEVYTKDITVIVKGTSQTVVFKGSNYVCVTSITSYREGRPFIAYVKHVPAVENNDKVLEKYRHVVAKLIAKKPSSKYFNHPNFDEHYKNGSHGPLSEEFLMQECERVIGYVQTAYHTKDDFDN